MILYRLHGFYLAVNAKKNLDIWEQLAEDLITKPNDQPLIHRLRDYF